MATRRKCKYQKSNHQRSAVIWSMRGCFFLIFFAIGVSYYLHKKYEHTFFVCENGSKLIHFHPLLNDAGSFLNLQLDVGYSQMLFIVCSLLGAMVSFVLYWYLMYLCNIYHMKYIVLIPACFAFSACVSRAIERIFWIYTMDFIAIRHIGILDIIDCYLVLACLSFIITAMVFSQEEKRVTKGMNPREKESYKHAQNKRFWRMFLRQHKRGMK